MDSILGDDSDLGMCPCGSAWFRIAVPDGGDPDCGPAVCISSEGGITGYAGALECVECGTEWDPTLQFRPYGDSHLRLVL